MNYIESKIFDFFISDKSKKNIEKYVLVASVISFIFHLILIYLNKFEVVKIYDPYNLLNNPISAIYTPFSFILIYEIYLLIYYLPRSISTYISKQFEIITLIVIRRIFKDISEMDITKDLIFNAINKNIFIDLIAALLLFFLIYLFRRNSIKSERNSDQESFNTFVRIKKWTSCLLIPILSALAVINFVIWLSASYFNPVELSSINSIFFDEFFQILILVDVLLLIFSFFNSDSFHTIIRNSGFIISTILIRISFMAEGLINIILILSSLLFGLFILLIYNECEKRNLFKN
ncbi:MAG: hypothetical protein CMC04_08375 [Flavobacteriaceae bacterium]|nr:hypothetical protein [Flavobacteriaceae bacterium]